MMNLTMSHPVPTFGDSFTITCYVCGMPSSKEWAQKARSRPCTPSKPYFPFLLQLSPLTGAVLREDGSTYLCAFCHASLEAQWSLYESQQVVPPPNRKYNIQKFICGVCGVETYRKRIRALPFQEFPFLEKQRQAGSITLGNNPLAIVCLDCSETLWAQSAEYDRWGLPVHKRHFNWMARPPPPEDSVEATVARLPSGETQLPRCPPIEPSMVPKVQESAAVKMVEASMASKGRSKGKGDSPKLDSSSPIPQSSRKTSLTSTTPPNLELIGGFQNQQPPVVTVAPMSSHTTVMSMRKDSLGLPPGLIAATGPPGIYPQPGTAVYPPAAAYAPYVWGSANAANREATQRQLEAYPYGVTEGLHGAPGVWPWLPQPSPDMLRYQSYVSSLQGRSTGESSVRSPTHTTVSSPSTQPYCSGDSPSRHQPTSSIANAHAHREHERRREHATRSETITSSDRQVTRTGSSEDLNYVRNKGSPEPRAGKRSPKIHHPQQGETSSSLNKPYPAHPKKLPKDHDVARSSGSSLLRSSSQQTEVPSPESTPPQQPAAAGGGDGSDDPEKAARRECHIPKKRNWHVFMKESQAAADEENAKKTEEIPHPKKKKSSLSMSEAPEPSTSTAREASNRSPKQRRLSPGRMIDPRPRSRTMDSAMDLSVGILPPSKPSSKAGAKFRIEYLCLSEPSKKRGDDSASHPLTDDAAPRTSVIKCAPKVPENTSNQTSQEDVDMPEAKEDIKSSHQSQFKPISSSTTGAESKRKISRISLETVQEEVPETASEEEQDKAEGVPQSKKDGLDEQRKGKEGDDDKEKGNSERQAQASKMNSDDDHDDKRINEDLPNLEQFIKETVTELVNREKEQEKITRESTDKQKHFLQGLGLITPDEKTELEIKSVVSRHERKTLPPLQLRADCKLGRKIDKQLKELLLKVSLEDPSLFQDKPEVEKCDFMAELGMKTAEKSEKTKREIKWRVILMERMRREIRDATTRGVKHEWEKSEILKSFADCDLDSFFSSLSFAALMASDDDLNQGESPEEKDKKPDIENAPSSAAGTSGVCINYPKYIPSYASAKTEGEEQGQESTKSVAEAVETSASGSSLSFTEPILKIPVLPTKTRLQSESSSAATANSDTDDSELSTTTEQERAVGSVMPTPSSVDTPPKLTLGSSTDPYPVRLDNLIQCSTSYWEQMKQNIDEILDVLESSKEDVPLEEKTSQVDKIRKHLKSQLGDIKEIEKRLRATGKTILSASRKRSRSPK